MKATPNIIQKSKAHPEPPSKTTSKIRSSWDEEEEKPGTPFHGSSNYLIPGLQNEKQDHETLHAAFDIMDSLKDGYLDKDAIRRALHLSGERFEEYEIDDMIRMVDHNADGKVVFSAFKSQFFPPPPVFKNYDIGKHETEEMREISVKKAPLTQNVAKDTISEFVGEGLKPSFIRDVFRRFMVLDKDESGTVSFGEFCQLLQMEPSPLLHNMFKMFDKDGSGEVDAKEFLVGLSGYAQGSAWEKIKFAFTMFDDDQSGTLSRTEVVKIVQSNAPELPQDQILRRVDELYEALELPLMATLTLEDFQNLARINPQLILPAHSIGKALHNATGDPRGQ